MRRLLLLLSLCPLAVPAAAQPTDSSRDRIVNCRRSSLADAVDRLRGGGDRTILFTGECAGPIVITSDGLTLKGVGAASIDGNGLDAVTVAGAGRVALEAFEVKNGRNGIVALNGAGVTLTDILARDNQGFGISVQNGSSALLSGVTAAGSGLHGLDVQTGSAVTVRDTLTVSGNRVFGINVNGSSFTVAEGTVLATGNALGIQIATNASAFINDPGSSITAADNLATGLTIVSGAHMVSFGGTITASGNRVVGVSVNSAGGLDLDAGSQLNTFNNGEGLLLQQGSVMTAFNNPMFSGVPGFSTINAHDNAGNGVRVQNGATLTLSNQARVLSNANGRIGLIADNDAGITLVNSSLTGNAVRDLQLTFAARADLPSLTVGTVTCDATVLVRGAGGSGITCPQ